MGDSGADQELVARVQGGDKRAFDLLVAKYQQRIVKLVSRYVKNQSDALDVAQEVFLKAYRALPKFRGDSAFYTWMYRIAINTAKNYLVMMSRRPTEVDLGSPDDNGIDIENLRSDVDTPERMMLTEEIKMTVAEAIESLPDDLKTAITLRELEGLTYEEIAQAMSCPIGTVRSRIFRAREAIDKRLRPLLH
jgi:RNA polymerase sigma-70 factor (ECF subfamily)